MGIKGLSKTLLTENFYGYIDHNNIKLELFTHIENNQIDYLYLDFASLTAFVVDIKFNEVMGYKIPLEEYNSFKFSIYHFLEENPHLNSDNIIQYIFKIIKYTQFIICKIVPKESVVICFEGPKHIARIYREKYGNYVKNFKKILEEEMNQYSQKIGISPLNQIDESLQLPEKLRSQAEISYYV